MGQLADRLDAIRVRARMPGVDIEVELRDRTDVRISFGESVYGFLTENRLQYYLAGLARLLYAAWLRQYRAAIDDSALDVDPHDRRDHEFLDARAAVESGGASTDARIVITAVGMREIEVRIAPGTVRKLTEDQFSARTAEAVTALIQDHLSQVRALKTRFYG
ncbi:hypothetical protein [Actinophytocola sp.]|uniref:hypothetical protein n=1 Tax=Actinophytocola sp. TaxID=1872138 RepID=UPI00389ACBD6